MKTITERVKETSNIPNHLRLERPPFPKKAKIEITSRCDLKCFFCQHTYDPTPKFDINPELCFKIIRELKEVGVEDLGLFWIGEPIMVKELPQYVSYAKEIGIPYVFLTTNGRLATLERIKPLFDAGLDSIKFSFNADDQESYKEICGVDAYNQVVANLKNAAEYRGSNKKPAIYASSVFDPSNPEPFNKIKELISPYVDEHYPLRLYGTRKIEKKDGSGKITEAQIDERRSLNDMLPCWALFTEPHITFDGHISACYCDHDPRLYMGDLKEMSLLEAWHSDKFVALRQKHLAKDVSGTVCESCIAYA